MRFTSIIIAGAFAIFASAQTTTGSETTTATASLTSAQASQAACLEACAAGDVNCQAKCIAVPSPDTAQVNATTECVANCNQGNGTAADNTAYGECVDACIGANYFTSTGTPEQTGVSSGSTGSAATATATGTQGSTASGTAKSTASGTASSSGSSASASGNAADAVRVGVTGASLFGMLAAFVAL